MCSALQNVALFRSLQEGAVQTFVLISNSSKIRILASGNCNPIYFICLLILRKRMMLFLMGSETYFCVHNLIIAFSKTA